MQKNQTRSRGSALLIIIVYTHLVLLLILHTTGILYTLGRIAANDRARLANKYRAEAAAYMAVEHLLREASLPNTSWYQIDGERVKVDVLKRNGVYVMIGAVADRASVCLTVETQAGRIVKWSES